MQEIMISLIVPVKNEEESIDFFMERTETVMQKLSIVYEYIFINDGSTDNTSSVLSRWQKEKSTIRIITLSRNFGKETALFCGLTHAKGKGCIPMDVDLQDPPELIPTFIEKWQQGYDMVYGQRSDRGDDSLLKRTTEKIFYKIYNLMAERPMPANAGDFRLLDRKVVEGIKSLNERNVFMKAIFSWVGFKSIGVPYKRPKRTAGKTKWNYWKLWNFSIDGFTSNTTIPLRIWTYIGAGVSISAFLYAIYVIIKTLRRGDIQGFPTLVVFILFFAGLQMIALGIMGEYIARIAKEVRRRPLYIIAQTQGFDEERP